MSVSVFTPEGLRLALAAITTAPTVGPLTVLLVRSGHDFTTAPTYVAAVAGDETVATGYARQAANVAGLTTETDGRVTAEVTPTAFGALGGALDDTLSGCYLFLDTGNDATAPLVMCVPWLTEQTTDGTPVTVQWSPKTMSFGPGLLG